VSERRSCFASGACQHRLKRYDQRSIEGTGWARISLAVSDETLEVGLERFRRALKPANGPS